MIQKQHDWILNILENPDANIVDLNNAGLNANNTSLLDEKVYTSNLKIQQNPLFQDELGRFDETKFHKFYEDAVFSYNVLSNETSIETLKQEFNTYGIDNIFAPNRKQFDETVLYKVNPNPDLITTGFIRVGEMGTLKKSVDELAQSLKVLANPTEVYASGDPNWDKAIWHDSPNDSFFTDFFETRVLATWDTNGVHTDPITGDIVEHQKGEPILNENGTYFYENLDGRDVYGKQVLNKLNVLTTDGSKWNKYDFFDSDGKEAKGITSNILKNAALVGSMFIPYVGPWVRGLTVANQVVGLTGTLGKMLNGSDSPTLSAMEGWAKSVNRQTLKSQYALLNVWCWENAINLVGDVVGLLAEQRFIFEVAPSLFKGNKFLNSKGKIDLGKIDDLIKNTTGELTKQTLTLLANNLKEIGKLSIKQSSNEIIAKESVRSLLEEYYHIGEILGKGYMTGIVVADTYGEAKQAGATDAEAALLTMGYAAAELALLNSDLGQWIMPELKESGIRLNNLAKVLVTQGDKRLVQAGSKAAKLEATKHWFNLGKKLSNMDRTSAKISGMVTSGALSEGLEEVSEELLADFSKTCFNVVQWLLGDTETKMDAWDNIGSRYLMSLFGGAIGGGLAAAGTSFNLLLYNYTPESAAQEIIWMLRNNKKLEIIKAIDKITLSDNNLSVESFNTSIGVSLHKPSNDGKSMNQLLKETAKLQLDLWEHLIKSEGILLSDLEYLDNQTLKDWRLAVLQNSPVSGLYLQQFNTTVLDILDIKKEIYDLENSKPTDSSKLSEETQERITKLKEKLKTKKKIYEGYFNGESAMNYISTALLSMSPLLTLGFVVNSFRDYLVKVKHNPNPSLTDLEIYKKEYQQYRADEYKNHIQEYATLFLTLSNLFKTIIENFAKDYQKEENEVINLLRNKLNLKSGDVKTDVALDNMHTIFTLAGMDFALILDKSVTEESRNALILEAYDKVLLNFSLNLYSNTINPLYKLSLKNALESVIAYGETKRVELATKVSLVEDILDEYGLFDASNIPEDIEQDLQEANLLELVQDLELFGRLLAIEENLTKLKNSLNELDAKPYTNITKFISETTLIDVGALLESINTVILDNINRIDVILFGNVIDNVNKVLEKIQMLRHLITASKSDQSAINIDNPTGYNVTLNQIAEKYGVNWNELPEISTEVGNIMELDLDNIAKQLLWAKLIYNYNEGKKITFLKESLIKLYLLIYKRLNKFIVNIDDSFAEKALLQKALNEAVNILEVELKKDFVVSDSKAKLIEKELLDIENILFDLFNNNKLHLTKDLFKDFNYFDETAGTTEDEILSDRVFVSYLASRAALKKLKFINLLSDVINPEEGLAPISAQEEAIFQNVAMFTNIEMLNFIYNLFNLKVEELFNSLSLEKKQEYTAGLENPTILDTTFLISFKNIQFTEGSAGSGKSTAVTIYTNRIMQILNPNVKNWYIHLDKERADKAVKDNLDGKAASFTKEDLLTSIFQLYKVNRDTNDRGQLVYTEDEILNDTLKGELNILQEFPDVIYIDELSHFDALELELIDRFALKYGIKVFASGDLNQSGLNSVSPRLDGLQNNYSLVRTSFKTPFKLNISMRTTNSQMDKSIRDFELNLDEVNIYYYESENELNGIKLVNNTVDLEKSLGTLLKDPEISEENPITVIYYSEKSIVKKFIESNPLYSDKVIFKKGSAALGLEGKYYIVDLEDTSNSTKDIIYKNYYTAITRASKGCILYQSIGNNNIKFKLYKDSTTLITSSPKKTYQAYAQDRKQLLELLKTKETVKVDKVDKPDLTGAEEIVFKENKYLVLNDKVYLENGVEELDKEIILEVLARHKALSDITNPNLVLTKELEKSSETIAITPTAPINNINNNKFTILLHSHNTLELGVQNDSGKIKYYGTKATSANAYARRIDSVPGLMKLYNGNEGDNILEYIDKLELIREILFNIKDKVNIINALNNLVFSKPLNNKLANGLVKSIDFGYVYTKYRSKGFNSTNYDEFTRHALESTIYNEHGSSQMRNTKSINAVITFNNDLKLLIPLFVLGNLNTYTNLPSNPISQRLATLSLQYGGGSLDFAKAVLNDPYLGNIPELKALCNLFLLTNNNAYIPILDPTWTPANNLDNYGMLIKTKTNPKNGFVIDLSSTPIPVTEFVGHYTATNKIYTKAGDTDDKFKSVHKGHAFILISQNPMYRLTAINKDEQMIEAYRRGDKDVTLVYVTPPKVDNVSAFLENLYKAFTGGTFYKMGNITTSYSILKILQNTVGETEFLRLLGGETSTYGLALRGLIDIEFKTSKDLVDFLLLKNSKGETYGKLLNHALFNLYTDIKGGIIKDKLDNLVKIIGDDFVIHYGTSFEFADRTADISPLNVQNYEIDGKPFVTYSKLDSSLFAGYSNTFGLILTNLGNAVANESYLTSILETSPKIEIDSSYPQELLDRLASVKTQENVLPIVEEYVKEFNSRKNGYVAGLDALNRWVQVKLKDEYKDLTVNTVFKNGINEKVNFNNYLITLEFKDNLFNIYYETRGIEAESENSIDFETFERELLKEILDEEGNPTTDFKKYCKQPKAFLLNIRNTEANLNALKEMNDICKNNNETLYKNIKNVLDRYKPNESCKIKQ